MKKAEHDKIMAAAEGVYRASVEKYQRLAAKAEREREQMSNYSKACQRSETEIGEAARDLVSVVTQPLYDEPFHERMLRFYDRVAKLRLVLEDKGFWHDDD